MSRQRHIAWEDVLDLRVVRRLGGIVCRRWNIGLGFGGADGTLYQGPAAVNYAIRRGPCELLRRLLGEQCRDNGRSAFRAIQEQVAAAALPGGAPPPRSLPLDCHAGLREVAAPILIEGEVEGFVYAGGYLHHESDGRQELSERLLRLGVPVESLPDVFSDLAVLSAADEGFLRELVEVIADEIGAFQTEAASTDRRQPLGGPDRRTRYPYDEITGESRPMQELYRLLDKVIDSDSTVLVQGENGTGKELIARAIHFNSRRRHLRFVVQNCSAFNDNLLDSELFGHKKGAFTGAVSDKQGLFEVADGSTFFLDEIGDMSPSLQVKLLRVLQEGTFIPVGDTQSKKVDVRIIAATNRDLKRMVERGEFREDLYYRINVIAIHVPPLRDRREDIPALIECFLRKQSRGDHHRLKKLSKGCIARLLDYSWPGNIRELENEIERLVVLSGEEKLIGEDLLSSRIRQQGPSRPESTEGPHGEAPDCLPGAVESLERTMIYEVLKRNHWNKTRAAQELQISRRNLIRKVNKYNLDQRRAPRSG